MKLKDAYHPHNASFHREKIPIKTIQKNINQRPPVSHKFMHKFMKKAGKKFKLFSSRLPSDIKERWNEKIPPYPKGPVAK